MRGWLVGTSAWGRPMMPLVGRDGSMYLTDDKTGVVYRIRSQESSSVHRAPHPRAITMRSGSTIRPYPPSRRDAVEVGRGFKP